MKLKLVFGFFVAALLAGCGNGNNDRNCIDASGRAVSCNTPGAFNGGFGVNSCTFIENDDERDDDDQCINAQTGSTIGCALNGKSCISTSVGGGGFGGQCFAGQPGCICGPTGCFFQGNGGFGGGFGQCHPSQPGCICGPNGCFFGSGGFGGGYGNQVICDYTGACFSCDIYGSCYPIYY